MNILIKKHRIIITGISLVFLLLILSSHHRTNAQIGSQTITIVPPAIEREVAPGDKEEGRLKVINDSDQALTFTATVRDFDVEDNQGTPHILPPNSLAAKYSAASWLGVVPNSFTIPAHSKQDLSYYLQVPADVRPGGHYAAVVYEPNQALKLQGSGAAVNTQIGTLFLIKVKGVVNESARVTTFSANTFQEAGPVEITTEILNEGDIHIRPRGSIQVTNLIGQTVQTQPLLEKNIFPGRSYLFRNSLGHGVFIGRLTATLRATYGSSNRPLTAVVTFWILPWKALSVAVLVIIIIVLAILLVRKKKQNKHEEQPVAEQNSKTENE